MNDKLLIVSNDIYYPGVLNDIKKSKEPFQPIYEAFTNAHESIKSIDSPVDSHIIPANVL